MKDESIRLETDVLKKWDPFLSAFTVQESSATT